jgi:hypothetical protein
MIMYYKNFPSYEGSKGYMYLCVNEMLAALENSATMKKISHKKLDRTVKRQ